MPLDLFQQPVKAREAFTPLDAALRVGEGLDIQMPGVIVVFGG
jgi:hypothetical protein